jgi:hypothetical protein
MLLFKAQEIDFVGDKVPEAMKAAEERLELRSNATIREAELWLTDRGHADPTT